MVWILPCKDEPGQTRSLGWSESYVLRPLCHHSQSNIYFLLWLHETTKWKSRLSTRSSVCIVTNIDYCLAFIGWTSFVLGLATLKIADHPMMFLPSLSGSSVCIVTNIDYGLAFIGWTTCFLGLAALKIADHPMMFLPSLARSSVCIVTTIDYCLAFIGWTTLFLGLAAHKNSRPSIPSMFFLLSLTGSYVCIFTYIIHIALGGSLTCIARH